MAPDEILVLAHRLLYYVKATPVISDREYDALEARLPASSPVRQSVGSDNEADYPSEAINLAQQLL